MVSCSADYTVHMWKLHTGEETMVFEGHNSDVEGVAVDSRWMLCCSLMTNLCVCGMWAAEGSLCLAA